MKIKPVGERALVKPTEAEEETSAGIVLPQSARKGPQTATVVALGDLNGHLNEGDVVAYARHSGTEVTLDDGEYLLLDAEDLLGVVEG